MMNFIYRLFLAFNSTYLIIVVYLIAKKYVFCDLEMLPGYFSRILFVFIPIILTSLSFLILKLLDNDEILKEEISQVELANNSFLPTYLGYFFVSLGISDIETLLLIFSVIFVFTFLSQTLYFNPIFLLFGYHFYFLSISNNIKIFLISRKKLKNPKEYDFKNLKRINDYTFIDTKK